MLMCTCDKGEEDGGGGVGDDAPLRGRACVSVRSSSNPQRLSISPPQASLLRGAREGARGDARGRNVSLTPKAGLDSLCWLVDSQV